MNSAISEVNQPNDFAWHFATVARTTPEQAAKVIEKSMGKKTFRILIGADAQFVDVLYKLLPTDYFNVSNVMLGATKFLST